MRKHVRMRTCMLVCIAGSHPYHVAGNSGLIMKYERFSWRVGRQAAAAAAAAVATAAAAAAAPEEKRTRESDSQFRDWQ